MPPLTLSTASRSIKSQSTLTPQGLLDQKKKATRKDRIQEIADRETERTRRSKLEMMVAQKLCSKYGTPHKSSINNLITSTVRKHLSETAHLSDVSLHSLEVSIKNLINDKKQKQLPTLNDDSASTAMDNLPGSSSNKSRPTSTQYKPLVLNPDDPKTNPWTIMDTLNSIESDEARILKASQLKQKQKNMRQTLDVQIGLIKGREDDKKEEDRKYLQVQARMLNEWKREQNFVASIEHMKNKQMTEVRDVQIAEKQGRIIKEKEDKRNKELDEIAKCRREVEREKVRVDGKKRADIIRLEEIKKENVQREIAFEQRKKEDADEEIRLNKEYIARADAEQRKREKALADRFKRYEMIGENYSSHGAGKILREQTILQERKINREAADREKADEERELNDKRAVIEGKKKMMETNFKMVNERKERERLEREKEHVYASRFRREGESFGAEEVTRLHAEKLKSYSHQKLLQAQIIETNILQKRVDMSTTEMAMNRTQMDKILKDRGVGDKIMNKIMNEKRVMSESVAFKYKSNIPGLSRHEDDEL